MNWDTACLTLLALTTILGLIFTARTPQRWRTGLAVVAWPLSLLLFWSCRQRCIWHKATPHPVLWLHDTERRRYTLFKRTITLPWRHRKVILCGPLVILLRPRPTFDAPILLGKGRLILTPLLFQLQLCWGKTSNVHPRDLF